MTVDDPWQRARSQYELLVWYCWPASMIRKALLTADAHSYGQKDRVADIANGKNTPDFRATFRVRNMAVVWTRSSVYPTANLLLCPSL